MKKRILSIMLAAAMLLTGFTVFAEEAEQTLSAIAGVDASKFSEKSNLNYVSTEGLGSSAGYGWAKYENVDFGDSGISEFIVNVAIPGSYAGKKISFYVDSISGSPFAELTVAGTGGWEKHIEQSAELKDGEIYGVHNVFVAIQTTATGNVKNFRAVPAVTNTGVLIPQSVINAGREEIFKILTALDIIEYNEADGFNAAAEVKSGEFVKAALMLRDESGNEMKDTILKKVGLKNDEGINAEKACEILMIMLNRQGTVLNGAKNYETAASLGIKCSSAPDAPLTWAEAMKLLYDASEVPPVEITSAIHEYDGIKGMYKTKTNNTLLIEYRDIHKSKGVLNMDYQTGLADVSDIAENQVLINNYIFDIGDCDVSGLLGYEVEYYYKSTGYENILLYIQKTRGNYSIEINAADLEGYSKGNVRYYDGQKEKNIKIPDTASIIYNGIVVSKYDSSMFNFKNGSIELISNNRDEIPEVVKLWNTVDYQFGGYVNGIIYLNDFDDATTDGDLQIQYNNAQNRIKLMNVVGIETEPERLTEGSICTVAKTDSIDGTFTLWSIWSSKKTVIGTVKSVDRTKKVISIDGKEYKISSAYSDMGMTGVYIGAGIKAYLNKYDEIAFTENEAVSSNKLGFVIRSYRDEDTDDVVIKMYDEDGKFADYKCHKNIRINGNGGMSQNDVWALVSPKQELCVFTTNRSGEIRELDFALENSSTADVTRGLYHYADVVASDSEKYKKAGDSLKGGTVILNSEFTLFKIPQDTTDYDAYSVSGNTLVDDEKVNMKCYNRVNNKLDVTIGVQTYTEMENSAETSNDIKYINKVSEEWNGDDIDIVIEYWDGTNQSKKTIKSSEASKATAKTLVAGDAIRFRTTTDGRMSGIVKVFTAASGGAITGTGGHIDGQYSVIKSGNVSKKENNLIQISGGTGEIFKLMSAVCYVFEDGEYRVGSINDIVSAENVGLGSKVYLYTKYGGVLSLVIIK